MARNVSLLELRTWARQLSDTEGDPNVTDAELTALANRHVADVYDRLVDSGPPDYFAATTQIVTTPGLIEYALGVDFRSLVNVYVRESPDERRQLLPMGQAARGLVRAPTGIWTVDVEFIPTPPKLEDDGDTFDGVSGWEELIVHLMARDVAKKRDAVRPDLFESIARLEARIASRARSRDRGGKWVTDLDETGASPYPWGWTGGSLLGCYRLRADNLELFQGSWSLP
jgi:hypothetical protein